MPKEIITRDMLTIATHKKSGKGHYILKSMLMTNGKGALRSSAETLCGLVKSGYAYRSLHVIIAATVTCERCKQVFAKYGEARLAKEKLKEVKMLETSDGKTFPLKAREAALKHEGELSAAEKQGDFVTSVKDTLFTVTTAEEDYLDEQLIEEFEEDILNMMENKLAFGDIQLDDFLKFFHEMLSKHGRTIRSMLIIYQKIHGTLVPCRNTMEKMKDAGIYL